MHEFLPILIVGAIIGVFTVVFLTAYADYALDAWKTEASGFILKPLTVEGIKEQLKRLHYLFSMGGTQE